MKEVIAFDIGGTKMRAAIVKDNKIIKYLECHTPKTRFEFLNQIDYFIRQLDSSKVEGIGIGIAATINSGKVIKAPNLPIQDYDLKKELEKKYKKRVEVGNDAGCFTRAEMILGSKKKNFILITIGTGIGGGIVIDGHEYRGEGEGAEFGWMWFGGKQWEPQWKETKKRISKEFGSGVLVSDLAKKRTLKGKEILEDASEYFGEAIASLITAFDPEVVVLGGGVEESGEYFLDMIRKSVKKYSFFKKDTPIKWTKLKKPGILGASLLIN